jgi:hypothetical protein
MVMVTDVFAVAASPAAVPDEVQEPATGSLNEVEKVNNIDDEFLALIYSDEELLRDEFDALMAAAWTSPPTADASDRDAEYPPYGPRSDLPAVRGRLRPVVGTSVRRLGARTRAPPKHPRPKLVTLSRTRGGLDFPIEPNEPE